MKILITGATGLVGTRLSQHILSQGHSLHFLTTSSSKKHQIPGAKGFYWNPTNNEIDPLCWEGVAVLIHLAGTSISLPWTTKNRARIKNSRTQSTQLLVESLKKTKTHLDTVVTASAIGLYPSSLETFSDEKTAPGSGFLSEVVSEWEEAVEKFTFVSKTLVKLRIGLVLALEGGVLPTLSMPVKWGVGTAFGSGKQGQSWIHLDDLCRMFLWSCSANSHTVYNAVAPNPVSQNELIRQMGLILKRPLFLPNIPSLFMRLLLGDRSTLVLDSQYVSSQKVQKAGFIFEYPQLEGALKQIFREKK
ncbi:MAG: TIGR01777 family oxidoreductase [Flavobacteriaceae bacterium]